MKRRLWDNPEWMALDYELARTKNLLADRRGAHTKMYWIRALFEHRQITEPEEPE